MLFGTVVSAVLVVAASEDISTVGLEPIDKPVDPVDNSVWTVTECSKWTPWINRDATSGYGDYELYSLLDDDQKCGNDNGLPLASYTECRSVGSHIDFDDYVNNPGFGDLNPTCEANGLDSDGFSCTNSDETRCPDFEVRFCCAERKKYVKCSKWGNWLDRDNPSGKGDYELYHLWDSPPCGDNSDAPYNVECQDIATGNDYSVYPFAAGLTTGCEADGIGSDGFFCNNGDRAMCPDFKVRFCCDIEEVRSPTSAPTEAPSDVPTAAPTSAPTEFKCERWTSWLNRDWPSGDGDWEQYDLFKPTAPCGEGVMPLDVECRERNADGTPGTGFDNYQFDPSIQTKRCQANGNGSDGFVCRNPGASTVCPNFMVRFCCA